jgi:hypothetical protein
MAPERAGVLSDEDPTSALLPSGLTIERAGDGCATWETLPVARCGVVVLHCAT